MGKAKSETAQPRRFQRDRKKRLLQKQQESRTSRLWTQTEQRPRQSSIRLRIAKNRSPEWRRNEARIAELRIANYERPRGESLSVDEDNFK